MIIDSIIRTPAVAGQFYPASALLLEKEMHKYLYDSADDIYPKLATPRAIIVPHAGYQFSGDIAGKAYQTIKEPEKIKRVVVLAHSHQIYFDGASLGKYSSFATPLGDIVIDQNACKRLLDKNPLFSNRVDVHHLEHSLEVQLPFLQTILPHAQLVPIICGQLKLAEIHSIAETLYELLWQKDTLFVVSSDFTHYGKSFNYTPFHLNIAKQLEKLDMGAISEIINFKTIGFYEYVESTKATICGKIPITILLRILNLQKEYMQGILVKYTTSGKLTHDYSHTVSYASIIFVEQNGEKNRKYEWVLSDYDKQYLLNLARTTLQKTFKIMPEVANSHSELTLTSALKNKGASFVTLHKNGELRGCIGTLEASEPLYHNVRKNVLNAAFKDYRFPPVSMEELEQLEIEISALSPFYPIKNLEEFVIGKHGIILQKNGKHAVFLPQVAVEQKWDKETTLGQLALKAGIKFDAWQAGATLFVFEAVVFKESDFLP